MYQKRTKSMTSSSKMLATIIVVTQQFLHKIQSQVRCDKCIVNYVKELFGQKYFCKQFCQNSQLYSNCHQLKHYTQWSMYINSKVYVNPKKVNILQLTVLNVVPASKYKQLQSRGLRDMFSYLSQGSSAESSTHVIVKFLL